MTEPYSADTRPAALKRPAPEPLAPSALGGGADPLAGMPAPRAPDPVDRAFALTYRRLGRRDHTDAQLRERLGRAGFDAAIVDEVLATLTAQGYVDDARFARRFIEDRRRLDGWGTPRICAALVDAGVAQRTIAAQLAVSGEHDELTAAVSLLRSRFDEPPRDERSRAKALGLLLRRGFDSDLAYDAVRAFECALGAVPARRLRGRACGNTIEQSNESRPGNGTETKN